MPSDWGLILAGVIGAVALAAVANYVILRLEDIWNAMRTNTNAKFGLAIKDKLDNGDYRVFCAGLNSAGQVLQSSTQIAQRLSPELIRAFDGGHKILVELN